MYTTNCSVNKCYISLFLQNEPEKRIKITEENGEWQNEIYH